MVHVFLKPGLENFEHYFTSGWDECNCVVVWAFFGIAFLWDWNENWQAQTRSEKLQLTHWHTCCMSVAIEFGAGLSGCIIVALTDSLKQSEWCGQWAGMRLERWGGWVDAASFKAPPTPDQQPPGRARGPDGLPGPPSDREGVSRPSHALSLQSSTELTLGPLANRIILSLASPLFCPTSSCLR